MNVQHKLSPAGAALSLWHADSRAALKLLPDNSIDSCVTDPPYHLTSIVKRFGKPGAAPAKSGKSGVYARSSAGFMGCTWDAPDAVPVDPLFASWFAGFVDGEGCFSVHKKNVNGYETFDCQFSLQLRDDDAPAIEMIRAQLGGIGTIALRPAHGAAGANPQVRYCISSQADCLKLRELFRVFPLRAKKLRDFEIWSQALDAWLSHTPGSSWDNIAYFRNALMAVKKYGAFYNPSQLFFYEIGREVFRVLKPGAHLLAFGGTRTYHRLVAGLEDAGFEIRDSIAWTFSTGFPHSHNQKDEWTGFGTALKPALEPIVLARKPLDGTVAQNLAKWRTGALNIDACRVGGRWPADLIHDGSPEVLAAFPGNAARFFHNVKTSKKDRNDGCEQLEQKAYSHDGRAVDISNPYLRTDLKAGNSHPTVKPTELMRYLCRLVTPPHGVVLDPFMGSGSTGRGAALEGFGFVGIEREAEYWEIAKARVGVLAP